VDAAVTIRLPLGIKDEQPQISESYVRPHAVADESLIAQICLGDKEALADLFRRYAGVVRGVAYRVLDDTSEDDLLQDIFLLLVHRFYGSFDTLKAQRGSGFCR